MLGDKNNREKREPKEIKYSNRKLIENKGEYSENEVNKSNSSDSVGFILSIISIIVGIFNIFSSNKNNNSSNTGRKKGCGCGCLSVIVIVFIVGVVLLLMIDTYSYDIKVTQNEFFISNVNNESGYKWIKKDIRSNNLKPYTIMIYMNGADLESRYGLASGDILEMIESKFNKNDVNVLMLTGGSSNWKSESLSKNLTIYNVTDDGLDKLADLGFNSFGDLNLLSNFVDYGVSAFPAEKYGFIFWDHGGGTLYGYGNDENFDGEGLSISEIEQGFSQSLIKNIGFEFIGFDCCLMSTIETAHLLVPYSKYFIASAETEPGTGWDYQFLKTLGDNSNFTGEQIGRNIVDLFVRSNEEAGTEATLTVIDLTKLDGLTNNFEIFVEAARNEIKNGNFNIISKARKNTKAFGYIGEDESFDLVDIKHLAQNLSSVFPDESNEVISSLDKCVLYNKSTSIVKNSNGLTTYIPYISKQVAANSVKKYKNLNLFPKFTNFLVDFSEKLTGERVQRPLIEKALPTRSTDGKIAIKLDSDTILDINTIQFVLWRQLEEGSDFFIRLGIYSDVEINKDGTITTEFDGYWAVINGETACFYETEKFDDVTKYVVPALLNGEDVNITVIFDNKDPNGRIIGAIPNNDSDLASKNIITIKDGDKIKLKYFTQLFLEDELKASEYKEVEKWILGEEFIVKDGLNIEIVPVDDELYLYGFWIKDILNNTYYTDFIEIRY